MKLCYQKFFFLTVFIFCVLGIFFSCTKIPELTLEEIEELISYLNELKNYIDVQFDYTLF